MTLLSGTGRATRDEPAAIDRIRSAAMKILATRGESGMSLRAVAAAAGVSLGSVQHHFATKAGLVQAVDDWALQVVVTAITQPVPDTTPDSVAEIGKRITGMIAANPDIADYLGRALIEGRPVGDMLFDTLLNSGMARWHRRSERGETRPDLDLTWAAINALVLALGALMLRTHIDRHLPEPLITAPQLERWQASVNSLLREGLFRRSD
ncbi:TetR family transcriptional regulator [Mycolicibacterium agri]|uniref:Putative transcriptional regulator, TetR family protein n=1 Tax=Mycolicibacterium agri TaxID=36811 RepID=A0A2A7MSJ1_MYCAG|nr:TetR/AcrR family transcriptional regulator [Mycolicibacterium agri]PEG34301.1 TetR family transcriptional regulator [Mycolicibacterium agri]GFG51357.1 putative transcriptional regulator, TetR family protein [Mycolicibacterium agri]